MRILYVNHGSEIGGAETNLINVLRYAKLSKFEPVAVLLPNDGPLASKVRDLGIDVGEIGYHAFHWRNPLKYCETIIQIINWVRRTRPSVIHLNHQWLVSHIVAAGIVTGTPVICHFRNYPDADFVNSHRTWLSKTRAIVVVSRAVEKQLLSLKIPEERVHVIYDGIELERFHQKQTRIEQDSSFSKAESKPAVGYLGRIVPEKGVEDLLLAVPSVLRSCPSAQFQFYGSDQDGGHYIGDLKRIASDLGVSENVRFLGFCWDVARVISNLNVLVIPSRYTMPEGLPLVALEGLAGGCLVVATPNSGITEVIRHGETGFIVEPENPELLAQGLKNALSLSSAETKKIRQNASKLMTSQFAIQNQVMKLDQLYQLTARKSL